MKRKSNGQFAKGNKGGGRPKGSRNKTPNKIRDEFLQFLMKNIDKLQSDFDELEPRERIETILKMGRYVLPTLKAVEYGSVLDELTDQDLERLINKLKQEYVQERS